MDIIYNYIYIDKKKFIQCSIEKEKKSVKTCHHACMLSYIFEKNMKKVLVILNYYKYGHAYIYIYIHV